MLGAIKRQMFNRHKPAASRALGLNAFKLYTFGFAALFVWFLAFGFVGQVSSGFKYARATFDTAYRTEITALQPAKGLAATEQPQTRPQATQEQTRPPQQQKQQAREVLKPDIRLQVTYKEHSAEKITERAERHRKIQAVLKKWEIDNGKRVLTQPFMKAFNSDDAKIKYNYSSIYGDEKSTYLLETIRGFMQLENVCFLDGRILKDCLTFVLSDEHTEALRQGRFKIVEHYNLELKRGECFVWHKEKAPCGEDFREYVRRLMLAQTDEDFRRVDPYYNHNRLKEEATNTTKRKPLFTHTLSAEEAAKFNKSLGQ